MGIGSVGSNTTYYGYGADNNTIKGSEENISFANASESVLVEKQNDGLIDRGTDGRSEAVDLFMNMYDENAVNRVNSMTNDSSSDWQQALSCKVAEDSTAENPIYEVTTIVNGKERTEKVYINDVIPTKATQQEMYAFFEYTDSIQGTEGSYEKFMALMDTAKQHGYWDGNDTYEQYAGEQHNWRDILPKVWGDFSAMGMYGIRSEAIALSETIEKAFISKIEFNPSKMTQKEIQTKVDMDLSWPNIPQDMVEVLYEGFHAWENRGKFGDDLEGTNNLFELELSIEYRIAKQIDADGTRGTEGMWDSAIKVLESMTDELDEYFGDGLRGLDSVKEEIAELKEMYRSVIEDLKAAKTTVADNNETLKSEEDDLRQALVDYIAAMYEKIKNGETEEEFQIGAVSMTLKEWDELLDKFDDLEDELKEAIKAEIEKQKEVERESEISKTDDTIDSADILSSETRKTIFREASKDKPELSYITCFTEEGIVCKRTGMAENEYLWKMDYKSKEDYEKVMSLLENFPDDWNLKFAPNEKFWKDYLSERIDKEEFVENLKQFSDKGKLNFLIERDGNTYIDKNAAKYCNYMNNPEDRIYTLQEFTELIANELRENQRKSVRPGDVAALNRIDEQIEQFKRNMLGSDYNKIYHKDYFSNNYIWRANNEDELFNIYTRNGELLSTLKYFDLMNMTEEALISEYGFNDELLKTLSYVREEG